MILKYRWQRCKNACSDKLTTRTYEVRRKLYLLQHTNTILKSKPDKHKSHKHTSTSPRQSSSRAIQPQDPLLQLHQSTLRHPHLSQGATSSIANRMSTQSTPLPQTLFPGAKLQSSAEPRFPFLRRLAPLALPLFLAFHLRREKMKLPLYCA